MNIIDSQNKSLFLSMVLQPFEPWPLFQFLNLYTIGKTSWKEDQPVARPPPTHRSIQTQNKHTQASMHPWDSNSQSQRLSERRLNRLRLRPRGHCDRQNEILPRINSRSVILSTCSVKYIYRYASVV
jgi:hypothetical protein